MPQKMTKFSLVTSPTGKGVIVIGGQWLNKYWNYNFTSPSYSDAIFELSPDDSKSITKLKWTALNHSNLTHPTSGHVAFPINNEVFNNLSKDYSNCYVGGAYQDPGKKKLKTKFWTHETFDTMPMFLKIFICSALIFISYYMY